MIKLNFDYEYPWVKNFLDYVDKDYDDSIPFEDWIAYEEDRPLRAANLAMACNGRLMGEVSDYFSRHDTLGSMWLEFDKDSDATIFVLRWS